MEDFIHRVEQLTNPDRVSAYNIEGEHLFTKPGILFNFVNVYVVAIVNSQPVYYDFCGNILEVWNNFFDWWFF